MSDMEETGIRSQYDKIPQEGKRGYVIVMTPYASMRKYHNRRGGRSARGNRRSASHRYDTL